MQLILVDLSYALTEESLLLAMRKWVTPPLRALYTLKKTQQVKQ